MFILQSIKSTSQNVKLDWLLCSQLQETIAFTLRNSVDSDEMPVAFHLGLHCLPKYLSTSIQNEKG